MTVKCFISNHQKCKVTGHLWELLAYENGTPRGLFPKEYQTLYTSKFCKSSNSLHAVSKLQYLKFQVVTKSACTLHLLSSVVHTTSIEIKL